MRIVYFAHYAGGSDAASAMDADLIAELRSRGSEVTVLSPFRRPDAGRIGGDVAAGRLPRTALAVAGYLRMLRHGIRATRSADARIVAQYHVFHPATLLAFLVARLRDRSLVARAHDPLPGSYRSAVQGRLFRLAFRFYRGVLAHPRMWTFVPSPELRDLAARELRLPPDRIAVVPNNVTPLPDPSPADVARWRSSLGLGGKRVLLQFGSFTPAGTMTFVEGLRAIGRPDVCGLILADPWRGRTFAEAGERLGIRDRLVIVPTQPYTELAAFLALADVCVGLLSADPTARGALPRSTLEAMAVGKPVVVCDGVVSASLVEQGTNCLLVPSEDPRAFASAVARILDDPALAESLGDAAKRTVRDRFRSDAVARVFLAALEGIP